MSQGGVSAGQVQSMINSAVSSVRREIGQVARQAQQNAAKIQEIEREMSKIAGAINQMTSKLSNDIGRMSDRVVQSNEHVQTAVMGNIAATNLVHNATDMVKASVQTNTTAIAGMESVRVFNELKAPASHLGRISEEVDSRYKQARGSVHEAEVEFDTYFVSIMEGYEKGIRDIGRHIFKILEEDFTPVHAVDAKNRRFQDFNLTVDAQRMANRRANLESNLEKVYQEELVPRLEMQDNFESSMKDSFALDPDVEEGALVIPTALSLTDGRPKVYAGVKKVEVESDLAYDLVEDDRYTNVMASVEDNAESILEDANLRPAVDDEIGKLRAELEEMHKEGVISAELLRGYYDYLDSFGLNVIE